jgi:phage virion morphogenesis protein
VQIRVTIEDSGVKDALLRLGERTGNLTPVMKVIGRIVRDSVIRNFEQGGRPSKWTPSKYAAREGRKTLIKSSRLMASITSKAYGDRAEIGTNVVYAAIHQMGGRAGRGGKAKIPARPFLMVQDEDWTEIGRQLAEYITGGRT